MAGCCQKFITSFKFQEVFVYVVVLTLVEELLVAGGVGWDGMIGWLADWLADER